jgi:riboflavin kinase / FMN adenylyltransferase
MQVHLQTNQLPAFRHAVITIGTFDGVHKGHQLIIDQMKKEAASIHGETVIITFHPHPRNIIAGKSGKLFLLTTMEERIQLLEAAGIDHLVIVPFTSVFAEQNAYAYIRDFLVKLFKPHTIIIGYDHKFGKNRQGDYHLLEKMAAANRYIVKEIDEQVIQEVTISSTRIREALQTGDIQSANAFLGYPYFFEGEVVHGDKRGRTIGFPTANLRLKHTDKLLPGDGVYAVKVSIDVEQTGILKLNGMMNIGYRPTVDGLNHVTEINLFDFNDDIYGKKMIVSLIQRIRGEQKFSGIETLKNQLKNDKLTALSLLK